MVRSRWPMPIPGYKSRRHRPATRENDGLTAFLVLVGCFGALALVAQVTILRQLMVAFYGNEMIVAVVLGGWLAGVYGGARMLGWIKPGPRYLGGWLWAMPLAWVGVLFLLLTASFHIPALTGLSVGEVASFKHILTWSLVLTFPVSFFVGGLFVLAGMYHDHFRPVRTKSGLGGAIFWVESAGSCLGLLIYTFVLVGRVGPIQIMSLLAGVMIVVMAWALIQAPGRRRVSAFLVLAALIIIQVTGLPRELDRAAGRVRFQHDHPDYELLTVKESPYQHLSLARRGGEIVLFGNQVFLSSWPNAYYYQVLTYFFLTESRAADRVLVAGRGPGGFIHEFLVRPVERLVYLALDPDETQVAARYLTPEMAEDLKDPRLTIVHQDPRRYLTQTGDVFDLIVINAPDPDNAQINRLYTLEFFQAAQARLSDRGVLVTSITGADNFWSPELASFGKSLYATMKKVFPEVVVTPGDTHFFMAGARPGLVTDDPEELARRFKAREYRSPYLTARALYQFFPPTGRDYIKKQLAGFEGEAINTDASPLSYLLRLIWWEKLTGQTWTRDVLRWAVQYRGWWPGPALFLTIFLLVLTRRPRPARAATLTMFTTGGAAMSLQVVLIFLFQYHYGVLYREIGLISAVFMAGLAAGGLAGRRLAEKNADPSPWLWKLEGLMALTALLTAGIIWSRIPVLILPLVALTGLLPGFEFSLLFSLHLKDPLKGAVPQALARMEASDHGGAVIGALFTGLILAPLFGLDKIALALAVLKVVNARVFIRSRVVV